MLCVIYLCGCTESDLYIEETVISSGGHVSVDEDGKIHAISFKTNDRQAIAGVFFEIGNLNRLMHLFVTGPVTDADLEYASSLSQVKRLRVTSSDSSFTMDCLANWESQRLLELTLDGASLGSLPLPPHILEGAVDIRLISCDLRKKDFLVISTASSIKVLVLDNSRFPAGSIGCLSNLEALEKLSLNGCIIDHEAVECLLSLPSLTRIFLINATYPADFIEKMKRQRPDVEITY